jgi:CDGSH-type Zn-finger protein
MYAKLIQRRVFLTGLKRLSSTIEPEVIIEQAKTEAPKEEVIDIQAQKNEGDKFKIDDIYQIKNKKLPERNIFNHIDRTRITNPNVSFSNHYDKEAFAKTGFEESNPIPVSAKLGPFEIINPQMENKTYHWCSCGLSANQPFCDSSHKGTKFRPINFKLAEKCNKMLLCGCKLSTNKPFCDTKTCVRLKEEEEKEISEKLKTINKI